MSTRTFGFIVETNDCEYHNISGVAKLAGVYPQAKDPRKTVIDYVTDEGKRTYITVSGALKRLEMYEIGAR